jgi:hypothetical protein
VTIQLGHEVAAKRIQLGCFRDCALDLFPVFAVICRLSFEVWLFGDFNDFSGSWFASMLFALCSLLQHDLNDY